MDSGLESFCSSAPSLAFRDIPEEIVKRAPLLQVMEEVAKAMETGGIEVKHGELRTLKCKPNWAALQHDSARVADERRYPSVWRKTRSAFSSACRTACCGHIFCAVCIKSHVSRADGGGLAEGDESVSENEKELSPNYCRERPDRGWAAASSPPCRTRPPRTPCEEPV